MTPEQLGRRVEDLFLDYESGNVLEEQFMGRLEAIWQEWYLERIGGGEKEKAKKK